MASPEGGHSEQRALKVGDRDGPPGVLSEEQGSYRRRTCGQSEEAERRRDACGGGGLQGSEATSRAVALP